MIQDLTLYVNGKPESHGTPPPPFNLLCIRPCSSERKPEYLRSKGGSTRSLSTTAG
jgi:hypothetical protein